jgi:hypothetical protein
MYSVSSLVPLSPLGWLSVDNAVITWDPISSALGPVPKMIGRSTPVRGLPVKSIIINGKALDPAAKYKVVLHDGFLRGITVANQSLKLGLDMSELTDTGIEVWRAVIDYVAQKGIKKDDLRVGKSAHTTGPDLALLDYGMKWTGSAIELEVENHGLEAGKNVAVVCKSGLPNDMVTYGTELEDWGKAKEIGRAVVGQVDPGQVRSVSIAWAPIRDGTYWPIRCQITAEKDSLPANSFVQTVYRAQP